MTRTSSFVVAGLLGVVVSLGVSAAQAQSGPLPRPTAPQSKPEARPDEATVEADSDNVLDVLANDSGVPPSNEERPDVVVQRLDDEEARRNMCGTVRGTKGGVFYRASADCIGKTVRFGYKVKLFNAQTNEDEEVYATVTVKVVARRLGCDVTNSAGRFLKIEGGTYDKAAAPSGIADIVELADGATFLVRPFCITLEPVGTEEFGRVFSRVPDDKKKSAAPEALDKIADQRMSDPVVATGISQRMAALYLEAYKAGGGQPVVLPTINEIVAAAWELQSRRADAQETKQFLISLRSGNLIWTSSPCDNGRGKFSMVGPEKRGPGQPDVLGKPCYAHEQRYRASFRLVVRQM